MPGGWYCAVGKGALIWNHGAALWCLRGEFSPVASARRGFPFFRGLGPPQGVPRAPNRKPVREDGGSVSCRWRFLGSRTGIPSGRTGAAFAVADPGAPNRKGPRAGAGAGGALTS